MEGVKEKRTINVPDFSYENRYLTGGYKYIAGIDEVGRGCWAGPLVAAAVILPPATKFQNPNDKYQIDGITDSKLLTPAKRGSLAQKIRQIAVGFGIGMASVEEIDNLGLQPATFLAYERAASQLPQVDFLLLDAYRWKDSPFPYEAIIKGDSISISIAAASIVAKVARDNMMVELHENCRGYRFDLHKGYGTKLHQEKLAKHGVSEFHRRSFSPIKRLINGQ